MSQRHLNTTPLLDYEAPSIQSLIQARGWLHLPAHERVGRIYDFVRNEILFGYNSDDALPASEVLADGYGQCNTKGTLLMALLRGVEIPCRFHGFTIDKGLQRGVVPELIYPIAPRNIIHSWVEVFLDGEWLDLEGFILDIGVLRSLQDAFPDRSSLCAYGAGTERLQSPNVEWTGKSTYIQRTGINNDLGVFDNPDDFYETHRQLSGLRGMLYRNFVRHWMNRRVAKIRQGHVPPIPNSERSLLPSASANQFSEASS